MKKLLIILFLLLSTHQAFAYPFSLYGIDKDNSKMEMLFEKTFFNVDVLKLEILFGKITATQLATLVKDQVLTPELEDKIADIAAHTQKAVAKLTFVRNVSLNQFLDGIKQNLLLAKQQGYITQAEYDPIAQGLPEWYSFLKDRGIKDGDRMFYQISKDSILIVYQAQDGTILLDQKGVGADKRLSVLGSYFAKGSDFRKRLIGSLF